MISRHWFMERRIKMQHLRVLVALGQHRTLHRAALDLNISQPAASKLIVDLEAAVQHPLFDRVGRLLVPNRLGAALISRAGSMLHELELASDEMSALVDGRRGRVAVGAIDGPAMSYMAEVLLTMRRDFPLIEIEIVTDSSLALAKRLQSGDIDVMIGRPRPELDRREYGYRPLGRETFVVAGRAGHELASGMPLGAADIVDCDWIVQSRGSTLREWFDDVFNSNALPPPSHVVASNSLLMTLAHLEGSDALTVLSDPVASHLVHYGMLARIPVTFSREATPYGIIRPLAKAATPALESFLAVLDTTTDAQAPETQIVT